MKRYIKKTTILFLALSLLLAALSGCSQGERTPRRQRRSLRP